MGGAAAGQWLKMLVSIDAALVLSGGVLTSYVGITGNVNDSTQSPKPQYARTHLCTHTCPLAVSQPHARNHGHNIDTHLQIAYLFPLISQHTPTAMRTLVTVTYTGKWCLVFL